MTTINQWKEITCDNKSQEQKLSNFRYGIIQLLQSQVKVLESFFIKFQIFSIGNIWNIMKKDSKTLTFFFLKVQEPAMSAANSRCRETFSRILREHLVTEKY